MSPGTSDGRMVLLPVSALRLPVNRHDARRHWPEEIKVEGEIGTGKVRSSRRGRNDEAWGDITCKFWLERERAANKPGRNG